MVIRECNWIEFIPQNELEAKVKEALLTEPKIGENLIIDMLTCILARKGLWVRSRVNLWKLIRRYSSPKEILNYYEHPLQPDIDILQCFIRGDGRPRTPLFGIEVKLFSELKQMLIPKASLDESKYYSGEKGYYSGIGQALSLLTCGLDFSYLWHVFLVPFEDWEEDPQCYDLIKQNTEWTSCYTQFIKEAFINQLHLPIGYKAMAISIMKDKREVSYLYFYEVEANPLHIASATQAKLRLLLTEKLGIEETIYQKQYLKELIYIRQSDKSKGSVE